MDSEKIKEIDESIRELETFIQSKIKQAHANISPEKLKPEGGTLNGSYSMNHFDLKRASEDFLDEMRTKSGKRSQTTRRLIRKIQHESNKSRHSNYEVCASVPTLTSIKRNLFDADNEDDEGCNTGNDAAIKAINEETKSKEDWEVTITNRKNKCFEYSVHKVASSEDRGITSEVALDKSENTLSQNLNSKEPTPLTQISTKHNKQTASGVINPMTESSVCTPKMLPTDPISPFQNYDQELPITQLDYSMSDFPTPKLPYHLQTQVIHKLNQEMQKLLNALSQLDQECTSLRYQLHASQVELTKAKLIGNFVYFYSNCIAKEHVNLNNTLKVQKEARERELAASKETITSLQVGIRRKDEELSKLAYCKLLGFVMNDV